MPGAKTSPSRLVTLVLCAVLLSSCGGRPPRRQNGREPDTKVEPHFSWSGSVGEGLLVIGAFVATAVGVCLISKSACKWIKEGITPDEYEEPAAPPPTPEAHAPAAEIPSEMKGWYHPAKGVSDFKADLSNCANFPSEELCLCAAGWSKTAWLPAIDDYQEPSRADACKRCLGDPACGKEAGP